MGSRKRRASSGEETPRRINARGQVVGDLRVDRAGAVVWREDLHRQVRSAVERLSIKVASPSQSVSTLSGGNQQKVSVGKWFGIPAALWIFDEPTQGIDVDAKRELYDIMGHLAQDGAAVWFISSDLRELLRAIDKHREEHNGAA